MKASTTARLDKLGKRIRGAPEPPRFPFAIVSLSGWDEDARAAYRAACDREDWAEANRVEAGQTGIPAPHDPPTGKRRPYGFAREIVRLVIDDADAAEPERVDDDDESAPPEPQPAATAEPVVEPPGTNPADVVGLDRCGHPETRLDRDSRLAAEAAMSAVGRPVPSPEDGPPVFNKWGELVSGRFRPPAPSSSSFQQWDRNGTPC